MLMKQNVNTDVTKDSPIATERTTNPIFPLWFFILSAFTMKKSKENIGDWLLEITEANSSG